MSVSPTVSGTCNTAEPFSIPPEFQHALKLSPCLDSRSDEVILSSLNQHVPVFSEKNVWAYWHSGILTMPEWQKRNVCDWVRICGPSWTVRVLDDVPESPNYARKFLPDELLPACFRDGVMDGPYKGQHAADFVRGACLYEHGGVWSDIGQILYMSFDRICWDELEHPDSPYRVFIPWVNNVMVANFFIAARKGDPFIKKWHEIFCALWEGKTNFRGVIQNPLLKNLELTHDEVWSDRFVFDFKVDGETVLEYMAQMVCWMRVCMLEGCSSDDFNGAKYWQNHVLVFDVLSETMAAEEMFGFIGCGVKMAELLSLRLDSDPSTKEYQDAYRVVWRMLTNSSTQKIIRGTKLTNSLNLGALWDMPENKGKDRGPGTFAELLRYGSVNFVQTRGNPRYVTAPPPPRTLKKGHLEP